MVSLALGTSASALASGGLTFSWQDNSPNESGFRVERSIDGSTFATLATVAADSTRFEDTSVQAGTRYW